MNDKIHVTPLKGLNVPNPEKGGAFLPEGGADVNPNIYWVRQEQDGSIKKSPIKTASKKEVKG